MEEALASCSGMGMDNHFKVNVPEPSIVEEIVLILQSTDSLIHTAVKKGSGGLMQHCATLSFVFWS